MFKRRLVLPPPGARTFFLWGPRRAGKTTLLRQSYPDARWIDLRKSGASGRYAARPGLLRQDIGVDGRRPGGQIVIDEVQNVPALLGEVRRLADARGLRFALCGSSARRVRRDAAGLLGGRAAHLELRGLVAAEMGAAFDLDRLVNRGCLPHAYQAAEPSRLLAAHVARWIEEDIAAERLVRNMAAFRVFLDAAALGDGEPVTFTTLARRCGVSGHTAKAFFGVLEDTFAGRWLPAWSKSRGRRLAKAPKFFFSDVGVVNHLARRGALERGSPIYGKAFENWVHHELAAFAAYAGFDGALTHWRPANGADVDFVLGDMRLAVAAKATAKVDWRHLEGLRSLALEHDPRRRVVACLEPKPRRTEDGIDVLPAETFARRLWNGDLVD